ncbi:FkbM family methyltransferase [Gammaproteobacteria bacterium]|nr:FkbM family methyltransferase [Gammaproteobacteria bacterium]|tara:strand:- start:359 stop:1207 length:849 start_codon:yes stop_codon:yes gene_type:complete
MNTAPLIQSLIENPSQHSRDSSFYKTHEQELLNMLENSDLNSSKSGHESFEPFGDLHFPYREMGAINTIHLFGLDELIIFSYYWANKSRYKNVADLGANIGLHSLIMDRCGFSINSFEPDPIHVGVFQENIVNNKSVNITINQKAISDKSDTVDFIRVLGNTTGSHLAGAKEDPYGELETFTVETSDINSVLLNNDFVKMDIEGQEATAILSTKKDTWANVEMILEVGTEKNAKIIFEYLNEINVNMFSQKTGWNKVSDLADVPTSYKEGSLFLSVADEMSW